jgi:hypothetical protein
MSSSHGTPRRGPGRALPLALAGTALTMVAVVGACRSQSADDFGAPAVTVSVTPAGSAPAVRVPIRDGAPPPAAKNDVPARLRIPALKLDAAVDAVGIDPATGDFAVPPSAERVGWYRYGPGFSATAGSIVVAGHVDSAV